MRPQVRPLVSSRGESTEPFRVRFASGTISLCWNRRANRVRSNLHERLLQPVLFRFPVRNLDPAFSLPVARHIPIPDDSRGRTLSEGHVHETTFRDCLQRVEESGHAFRDSRQTDASIWYLTGTMSRSPRRMMRSGRPLSPHSGSISVAPRPENRASR